MFSLPWLVWLVGGLCVIDTLFSALAYRRGGQLLNLDHAEAPAERPAGEWPSVSVVVAACNEEDTIEPALHSLLALDYPQLEVVVVNDRSTDRTGEIIERVAAGDPRVRAVHVEELPGGWLGKVHALYCGSEDARGEWLLFIDADVHLSPSSVRRAMEYARHEQLDQVSILPQMEASDPLSGALIATFAAALLLHLRVDRVGDPEHPAAVGVGAFNLVRGELWRKGAGFPAIRMEVADDMAVGLLMKQAGARIGIATTGEHVRIAWYPSLGAMFTGMEKNIFGVMFQWRFPSFFVVFAAMTLLVLAPFVAFALGSPVAAALGCLCLAGRWTLGASLSGRGTVPGLAAPLFPIGQLLLLALLAHSARVTWKEGGINWRGTHYSLAELRAGQVFKPPPLGGF
jgi:hypothetical protein